MRSKTIRTGRSKARIEVGEPGKNAFLSIAFTHRGGATVWMWPTPKKLRAFGQSCIQIADEIDAAKEKK